MSCNVPGFLAAACLVGGIACATPFPLNRLQNDLTMDEAIDAFGKPRHTSAMDLDEAVRSLERENARIYGLLEAAVERSEIRGPAAQDLEHSSLETLRDLQELVKQLAESRDDPGVISTWTYPHEEVDWAAVVLSVALVGLPFLEKGHLTQKDVALKFEGDRLVGWEVYTVQPALQTGPPYASDDPHDPSGLQPGFDDDAARYKAMKKAAKRLGEGDLSNAERGELKSYYKKLNKNPDMSAKKARKIQKKIKKIGK